MQIRIRFFAAAAEAANREDIWLEIPEGNQPASVADIKSMLLDQIPALHSVLARSWFARNDDYATSETLIADGDELAIIPPVSGGEETHEDKTPYALQDVAITKDPLSPSAMYDFVLDANAGAIVVFGGTVREFTRGRQTDYLEYEAYDRMALAKMRELIALCREKWPIQKMAVWHRVGKMDLTETSVLIGVSTPHRKDAFAAGEYAIKTLKRTVPIWKKEFFTDGEIEWMGPEGPWNPLKDGESDV